MRMGGGRLRRWFGAGAFAAALFGVIVIPAAGLDTPKGTVAGEPAATQQQEPGGTTLTAPGIVRERPAPLTTHVLEAGSTVSTVATLYGVDTELLLTLNGIDDPAAIPAGSELLVPEPPPPPEILPCGDLLAPVDKAHGLPDDCTPETLVQLPGAYAIQEQHVHGEAYDALITMLDAAAADGHELYVRSGYRSFDTQAQTFQFWVDQLGLEEALRVSAPPGHSEHQLGTAVDITNEAVGFELVQEFADTAGGQWLEENAADFGFVLSYPEGEEQATGFIFEPWHYRYIGAQNAQDYLESGLTLNQHLAEIWLPGRHLVGGELE